MIIYLTCTLFVGVASICEEKHVIHAGVTILTEESLRFGALREKCPNAEFFLVRIFHYLD